MSVHLKKRIKDETGVDISKETFSLKDSDNVELLHTLLADKYNIPDRNKKNKLVSYALAPLDRKPNIIFDVTLKDTKKLSNLVNDVVDAGYSKDNIHVVWILNDYEIAVKQNKERDRVVPADILLMTHEGVSMTMQTLLKTSSSIKSYMDGDFWIVFNKEGVDNEWIESEQTKKGIVFSKKGGVKKNGKGKGGYFKKSRHIKIKNKGGNLLNFDNIGKDMMRKVRAYVPSKAKSDWKK